MSQIEFTSELDHYLLNECQEKEIEFSSELDRLFMNDCYSNEDWQHVQKKQRLEQKFWRGKVTQVSFTNTEQWIKVQLEDNEDLKEISLNLKDDWKDTKLHVGDLIHFVGQVDRQGQASVDADGDHLIILQPDTLISCTLLADSFQCLRKAVLSERIPFKITGNPPTVLYGTMIHALFQELIVLNNPLQSANSLIVDIVSRFSSELYAIGEEEQVAIAHLNQTLPAFKEFFLTYLSSQPKQGKLKEHRGVATNDRLAIHKILDIEENIWSPVYGLKGKVDATVQVSVKSNGKIHSKVVPFELKTGKSTLNISHRAQTTLYTLLLSDRYDLNVEYGLLYYCKSGEIIRVPKFRDEIKSLIMGRNELAGFLVNKSVLPPVIQDNYTCLKCFCLDSCMIYHKVLENGTLETSGIGPVFEQKTAHLSQSHVEFLKKWDSLITLEESEMTSERKELWCMSMEERVVTGKTLPNLIIENQENSRVHLGMGRYKYTFIHDPNLMPFLFTNAQIMEGDAIVVSTTTGQYAIAIGFVLEISSTHITVALDKQIRVPCRITMNQNFEPIFQYKHTYQEGGLVKEPVTQNIQFRIDKDVMTGSMSLMRENLLELFTNNEQMNRLKQLIVELKPPLFQESLDPVAQKVMHMNSDQLKALETVLKAKDYVLIMGMPGTGKSSTIAQTLRILASMKKSVLITSYTHSALDNILLKLKDLNVNFLRLGNEDKVHKDIKPYLPLTANQYTSVSVLENIYSSTLIVGTTCLGINHPIFSRRTFDYVIVDEASQLTLPVCLGPLRFGNIFVLVGDHKQLSPVIKNRVARDNGLSISLFQYLAETNPSSPALVTLQTQYRMNKDIMYLSNRIIYGNRLLCANEQVASSQLKVTDEACSLLHSAQNCQCTTPECWIYTSLKPSQSVVFLDTDALGYLETSSGKGSPVVNKTETLIIVKLVRILVDVLGIHVNDIGVTCAYRSQWRSLQAELTDVEIKTIDQFQGRDKNVLIVSCTRSNSEFIGGDLWKDPKRWNVMMTRAKQKLIIVGSRATMKFGCGDIGKQVIQTLEEKNWVNFWVMLDCRSNEVK